MLNMEGHRLLPQKNHRAEDIQSAKAGKDKSVFLIPTLLSSLAVGWRGWIKNIVTC